MESHARPTRPRGHGRGATPRPRAPEATTTARGVSLIECLIVVAILGVLLAGAVPGVSRWMARHQASTAINDLSHAIALARSEALRRSHRVYVAPHNGRWRDGWAVFVDRNDNRVFDPVTGGVGDDAIALHDPLARSITIGNTSGAAREPFTDVGQPQRPYVMFDGSGYPRQRNGGFGAGGIVVTARVGTATTTRTLCLASYGRLRVVENRATC